MNTKNLINILNGVGNKGQIDLPLIVQVDGKDLEVIKFEVWNIFEDKVVIDFQTNKNATNDKS